MFLENEVNNIGDETQIVLEYNCEIDQQLHAINPQSGLRGKYPEYKYPPLH